MRETSLGIWEIAVLSLLRQAPMHPYRMQRLLHDYHKDEILALKRGSLYHAIARLVRVELIAPSSISREGRRPERTAYRITPEGRRELIRSLRQIIATPRRESSEFMAAMSFLVHLTPAEALPRLQERCERLEDEIAKRSSALKRLAGKLPRIHLIESEYLVATLSAELHWVHSLIADLRTGKLDWDLKTILKQSQMDVQAAHRAEE